MNSPRSTGPDLKAVAADTTSADDQPQALRLQLDPHRSTKRSVDGAWWPRSLDVTAEITQLVIGAENSIGRIDRVGLHAAEWSDHPRRVLIADRVLRLGFFSSSGASRVNLVRRDGDDIVLLVIPLTATTVEAARAMARAVDSADRSQPAELLAGP